MKKCLWSVAAAIAVTTAGTAAYAQQAPPASDGGETADGTAPIEVVTPEFGATDIDRAAPVREEWTSTSRTYETSEDGVMATEMFSEPVNIRNGQGDWVSVDARLTEAADDVFETRRTALDLAIAADPPPMNW